jgi:uncharacterized membrane protein HdeD (DUF308 family)
VIQLSSILQQTEQSLGDQLKRIRWLLGIMGVLSVAWGIVIIVWPNISLFTLVILFGVYALASGILGLITAISTAGMPGRGWLVVYSLAGIVVGVLVFLYTDMSALALLYVIGAYAIALGIITIGGAFWLPLPSGDRILLTLAGALGILFGVVMFAKPGDGALVLLSLIAAYSLVVGVAELVVAIGGERLLPKPTFMRPADPQTSH